MFNLRGLYPAPGGQRLQIPIKEEPAKEHTPRSIKKHLGKFGSGVQKVEFIEPNALGGWMIYVYHCEDPHVMRRIVKAALREIIPELLES